MAPSSARKKTPPSVDSQGRGIEPPIFQCRFCHSGYVSRGGTCPECHTTMPLEVPANTRHVMRNPSGFRSFQAADKLYRGGNRFNGQ
jgi:hypothetical protein